MTIEKGEKVFVVRECAAYWSVSISHGAVTVNYQVDKAIAPDTQAIADYIQKEDIF